MNKKEKAASDKAKEILFGFMDGAFGWKERYEEEDREGWPSEDLIDRYVKEYFAGICSRLNIDEISGKPLPPKKRRSLKKEFEERQKRVKIGFGDEASKNAFESLTALLERAEERDRRDEERKKKEEGHDEEEKSQG